VYTVSLINKNINKSAIGAGGISESDVCCGMW